MSNLTNEKFIEELDRDYPNFDWDNFDIDKYPDVWKISFKQHRKIISIKDETEDKDIIPTEIHEEYSSEKDAESRKRKDFSQLQS